MATFQYEALRLQDRSRTTGVISADNERHARELLREQELITTRIKAVGGAHAMGTKKRGFNPLALVQGFQGLNDTDRISFARNLAMMIKAGIPLTDGLLFFENYAHKPVLGRLVNQLRQDILNGVSLSAAMAKKRGHFDEVFINMIKAGETSGDLDKVLFQLTDYMTQSQKLKSKVISASIYPAVVLAIAGLVLIIIFLVVFPTFEEIFKKLNVELPLITQVMMFISKLFKSYWFVTFPAIFMASYGIFNYLKSSGGKLFLDHLLIKVPVLGELLCFVNSSFFITTLKVTFAAGVPVTEALRLATQTILNIPIRSAMNQACLDIESGQRLAAALGKSGYIPELVLLMISTGEESGNLDEMLESAHEFLDRETHTRVDVLTTLIEPLLLVVLGGIVAVVALSIYLPMFSIYENL
jgi:type II secretory pathway component PulF